MIYCFGSNHCGQLGIGDRVRDAPYTPSLFGSSECDGSDKLDPDSVKDIQCGGNFTMVLLKNGTMQWCGMMAGTCQDRLSHVTVKLPLKCVQVSCGRKHVLALMDQGIVLSWGVGYFGQLGHGSDASITAPTIVSFLEPRRLGDIVKSVTCGRYHSGVVTESNRVFMWGLNRGGQCGLGFKSDCVLDPSPIDINFAVAGGVKSLVLSRNHSALLTGSGKVYVWGDATLGRLGVVLQAQKSPSPKHQMSPIEIPTFQSMRVTAICSGDLHMLALVTVEDGQSVVYSWGFGGDGQTGHSTLLNVRTPKRIEFFDDKDVVSMGCGSNWSMAITRSGKLYTWGYGDGGWLGIRPSPDALKVEVEDPVAANLYPHVSVRSFDSRHNVVTPQRVRFLSDWNVARVRAGGGHMVVQCSDQASTDSGSDAKRQGSGGRMQLKGSGANHRNTIYGSDSDSCSGSDSDKDEGAINKSDQKHASSSRLVSSKSDSKQSKMSTSSQSEGKSHSAGDISRVLGLCQSQNIQELKALLSINPSYASFQDGATGNTPLIVSCQGGNMEVCQLLVRHGADVDMVNNKGNSPLHYCFNFGFETIGEYLIGTCGADEFAVNKEGLTCYEGLTHSDLSS